MHPHTLTGPVPCARGGCPRRRGFSLLEMVLSLAVLGIIFAAVGSVFVLASKVMPAPDSAQAAGVRQSAALSRLTEDLEAATFITEHSANAVTMVFPDRTGDGVPDRYRYAWNGKPGSPLTLSINGSDPATVVGDVNDFSVSMETREVVDSVPARSTVSEETLLFSHTTATTSRNFRVRAYYRTGQLITPTLPAGATSYTITRAQLRGRRYMGGASGISFVKLMDVNGQVPGANTLVQVQLNESSLGSSYGWAPIQFATPVERPASAATALTIDSGMYTHGCELQYDRGAGAGRLTYTDAMAGGNSRWSHNSGQGLMIRVYGTYKVSTPGVSLTRTVYTGAKVRLQVGTATAYTANVALYCTPGHNTSAWWASFDKTPANTDLSGDGADWVAQSGAAAGAFQNGRWNVDGVLYTKPDSTFAQPILVEATMGADAANRSGAMLQINADQAGGQAAVLTVQAGRDAAGKHYVRVYDTSPIATAVVEATELSDNPPRIQLLIAPANNAAALIVNGQPISGFTYTPRSATGNPGRVYLSEGVGGVFDDVRVHVGGTAVVTGP